MTDPIARRHALGQRVRTLVGSLQNVMHPVAYELVDELQSVGELQVAVEHLCDLLCEDQVLLSSSAYGELVSLVEELGVKSRYVSAVAVAVAGETPNQ